MSRIVKATSWSSVSTLLTTLVTVLQISILSHHIQPETYGQFAIITLVIEIMSAVALGGISTYIIHKVNITRDETNTCFVIVSAFGLLTFLLIYSLIEVISVHINTESIVIPLQLSAIILPVSAVSSQYVAIALKSYSHNRLAKIEIASKLLSFFIALFTIEHAIYCLVISNIAFYIFRLTGLLLYFSPQSKLSLSFDAKIAIDILRYGIFEVGSQSLNIIRKQLDIIVLSSTLTTSDLGIYHVIKQLASRPAQALQPVVNNVALPTFAILQKNYQELKTCYLDFIALQSLALSFFYVPVVIFSKWVAELLLGDTYASMYFLLSLLGVFWFLRVAGSNLIGSLVLATGKTKANFYWNLGVLIPSLVIILVSSKDGIITLAYTLILFQMLIIPIVNIAVVNQVIKVTCLELIKSIGLPLMLYVLPISLLYLIIQNYSFNHFFIREIIVVITSICVMFACLRFNSRLRGSVQRLIKK